MQHREPLEDWEKELHQDLMQLPELEAPSTLIPGVMSRIKASAAPAWYQLSWWQWPVALRLASGVVVAAVLAMLAWAGSSFGELGLGRQLVQGFVETRTALGTVLDGCVTALNANGIAWSRHGQMILLAAATLLFAAYLTCVAAGTALYQLTWRRSS